MAYFLYIHNNIIPYDSNKLEVEITNKVNTFFLSDDKKKTTTSLSYKYH